MHPPGPAGKLLVLKTADSTQDQALALVRSGDTRYCGVRALYQLTGRGRRGARWEAPAGTCLLVTYIMRGVPADRVGHLGFAAAVAVCEAVDSLLAPSSAPGDQHAAVKWPNDVLMGGRKLAGILIQTVSDTPAILVGIGLNVNVVGFGTDLGLTATSLLLETGRQWDVQDVERAVRERLAALVVLDWPAVLGRWRERDATPGLQYRALTDDGEVDGTAVMVADSGALLLRTPDGRVLQTMVASASAGR